MWWWTITTTIGWSLVFLGIGLRYSPLGTVSIPESIWYSLAAGFILGLFIGLAQWMILRLQVRNAAWWIPTNMLAFGIACLILGNISKLSEVLIAFTIPSIFTGIVLWLLFDKLPRENKNTPKMCHLIPRRTSSAVIRSKRSDFKHACLRNPAF